MSETIIVSNGSLENNIGNTMSYVFCIQGEVRLLETALGTDYYYLDENGYMYAYED